MSTAHFTVASFNKVDLPTGSADEAGTRFTIRDNSGTVVATGDAGIAALTFDLDFIGNGDFVGAVQSFDGAGNLLGTEVTANFSTNPTKQFNQPNGLTVTVS